MSWKNKPPELPEEGFIYCWYYDIDSEDMWPAKISKGSWKLYAYDGLWLHDKGIELPEKPTQKELKNGKKRPKRRTKKSS